MLDDQNVIRQRDSRDALGVAAAQYEQARVSSTIINPAHDGRPITRVVVAGMGGSALAALQVKAWLEQTLAVPLEVIRHYDLPEYVDGQTLVIASSYSGNTEETLSGYRQARDRGAQLAVIASGGALRDQAVRDDVAHVVLPGGVQPRMGVVYNLRALTALLAHFGVTDRRYYDEIADATDWLQAQTAQWLPGVTTDRNDAKQLALTLVGKTPVFYAGHLMAPIAYKWKISINETSKNVAFCNEYPEFNHNEFMGWTSHPVEKPFAVVDLMGSFDHPQVTKRFMISDRLLSGRRPKATVVQLEGESVIRQMLWASVLADFVSIYVAILNGVDPTPVDLIEKLKQELAAN